MALQNKNLSNYLVIGWVLLIVLLITPLRAILESNMTTHILLQYPLLSIAGFLIGSPIYNKYKTQLSKINTGGIPGILLVSFTLLFWMIPKWMDFALTNNLIAIIKYLSFIFLIGFTLRISWQLLNAITKAFLKIELITMMLRIGWIFMIYPDRLCNSYLINDQATLGLYLIIIAIILSFMWLLPVFF